MPIAEQTANSTLHKKVLRLMGNRFEISVIANDAVYANTCIDAAVDEIQRIQLGFGGIGKSYAAEKAKSVLQQLGITSGIVNAAGDLTAWGSQPNGEPWTIGIADPDSIHHPFSSLNITNMAIATSGNYEKYVVIDGKKYSHTIDPKTGLPVSGIKSVTIICPSAELADAMATPVVVMGTGPGLDLINQIKNIACIIIDDDNNLYTSANIKIT